MRGSLSKRGPALGQARNVQYDRIDAGGWVPASGICSNEQGATVRASEGAVRWSSRDADGASFSRGVIEDFDPRTGSYVNVPRIIDRDAVRIWKAVDELGFGSCDAAFRERELPDDSERRIG